MDDKLEQLMQNLGNAIDESLSESKSIAKAIVQIKEAGYEVFLVLEATIVFNKRREDRAVDIETGKKTDQEKSGKPSGGIKITKQDQGFLGDMRISWGNNGGDENGGEEGKPINKKKKK